MNPPRSAYLHIPFCHRRCFYCDFAVIPLGNSAREESGPGVASINSYLDLLHREISMCPLGPPLSTIYIGGGTPSLLNSIQIDSLLTHLKKKFGLQSGAEITMEIDPSTFIKGDIEAYGLIGINRLSIGGQSFNDNLLKKIGRLHSSEHLLQSCEWVNEAYEKGVFHSWSLDLIQNLPEETLSSWSHQLKYAIGTGAPHLSIYDLVIEPETVFGRKYLKGELGLPTEELSEEINISTGKILKEAGFARYEISSYSLPGHTSRHNRMYWSGSGWWGFGMGSTSAPWGQRLARPKTIVSYRNWILSQEREGVDPTLSLVNAQPMPLDELLMIGLRRREGVHLESLAISSGWNKEECDQYLSLLIESWSEFLLNGLLIEQAGRFFLSNPKGMEVSNQVLIQMMIWWDSLPMNVGSAPNP